MFYVTYMVSELRRRRGRTVLTALGLAVGVGLVVAVSALSTGLDRAQAKVLKPLTGVGTDLSVSRPVRFTAGTPTGQGPRALPRAERSRLQQENGGLRFGLQNLGKPGAKFTHDSFLSTSQLTFPQSEVAKVRTISGVKSAAGGLTLTVLHLSGRVPKQGRQSRPLAPRQNDTRVGPPSSLNFDSRTVTGVDWSTPDVAAVTPGQIVAGHYLESAKQAVLNLSYARRKNIHLGDTISFGTTKLHVVGFARTPLGGQASDVYMDLGVLQKLSGRSGRINTIYVRATSASQVGRVATAIRASFSGASVTTAKDLADRVSGSLIDAKNLTKKLGTALEIVGLLAAFLIAGLLTLSSVTKRIRELGTLKALGWSQPLVVRQVTGESLLQGVLGGVLGIAVGVIGAALISAFSPTLRATVAQAATQAGPGLVGAFGQGNVTAGSTTVALNAPVSIGLIALAVGLAVLGGLLSGAVGALRASRLRPADALRHID
jgi:ABC-type antimicrobial peptide transport system permease subunit